MLYYKIFFFVMLFGLGWGVRHMFYLWRDGLSLWPCGLPSPQLLKGVIALLILIHEFWRACEILQAGFMPVITPPRMLLWGFENAYLLNYWKGVVTNGSNEAFEKAYRKILHLLTRIDS